MSDALYEKTEAFCALYTEDRLTAILEAGIVILQQSRREGTVDDITFSRIDQHDVINHTFYGYFQHEGEEVCFSIDNGNNAGTVVNEFGENTDLSPVREVTVYRLKAKKSPSWGPNPDETELAYAERVAAWRKRNDMIVERWSREPWFQEMERSYNYDRHFAPGGKIETHYREKAEKRGLVFEPETVEVD